MQPILGGGFVNYLEAKISNMQTPLNFKKELIGNFGCPIWENPTEAMVEAAFKHHGLNFRYITTEVPAENLKTAFEGVKAMGYKGFNCTIPHKVAVIAHLDGLGESAALIEAVNCVVERDGKYIGENTDGKGFLLSLQGQVNPEGKHVVILGAGGAARAVCIELALAKVASLTIVNRSVNRGQELVDLIRRKTSTIASFVQLQGLFVVPQHADIIVNCTNIGLYPDVDQCVPIDLESLNSNMLVCDLVPSPPMTTFLRGAQRRGCQILDGLGMLVNQGKIGIKYWTGVDVDITVMQKELERIFS